MNHPDDPTWEPPGTQRVIDGKTWTLARYDLAMWVPTHDASGARDYLAQVVAKKFNITQGFDLKAWVEEEPSRSERYHEDFDRMHSRATPCPDCGGYGERPLSGATCHRCDGTGEIISERQE